MCKWCTTVSPLKVQRPWAPGNAIKWAEKQLHFLELEYQTEACRGVRGEHGFGPSDTFFGTQGSSKCRGGRIGKEETDSPRNTKT